MSFNFTIPELKLNNAGTPPVRFMRNILDLTYASGEPAPVPPSYVDIIVSGTGSVTLLQAKEDGLNYVKLFGGCEQRNLPSGYTELDSITMEAGACAIGLTQPTANSRVELDFATTTLDSTTRNFYGGRYNNAPTGAGIRLTHNSSKDIIAYGFDTNSTGTGNYRFQNNTRYKYIHDNGTLTLISGGSTVYTQNFTMNDTTTSDVVINGYRQQTGTIIPNSEVIIVYAYKVYNAQGVLVENWIPALKGTTVCFYDTVSGTDILPEEGTFTAGAVTVPTPDTPIDIISNNGVLKARLQSGLPLGYTLLDSITGDGLVGLSTGLTLQAGDIIDMEYEWLGAPSGQSTDRFFFGTSNADASTGGCWAEFYTSTGSTTTWYVRFSSLSSVNTPATSDQWKGHITLKRESFTVNNVEVLTPTYNGDFQSTVLTFFGRFNATGDTFAGAYLKVKSFTVKNNGAYRYYGIPCRNTNNELTFYDIVSGADSTKVGTGTFTAGNTISDPIEIYTDGTVETVTDSNQLTATAQMLLSVGNYKDTQEVLTGSVTRNTGIKVLDGTEDGWSKTNNSFANTSLFADKEVEKSTVFCTHFQYDIGSTSTILDMCVGCASTTTNTYFRYNALSTVDDWKQWLKDQYNAGNPVVVLYPLATPTTETVTGQTLTIQEGSNIIQITQASINNLPLEVSYKGIEGE